MKNDTENGRHSTRMLSPTILASNPPKEIIKKSKQTDTHRHIYSTPRYHKFIAKKRYNEEIAMSLANHRCTMLICFLFVSLYLFLIVFFFLFILFSSYFLPPSHNRFLSFYLCVSFAFSHSPIHSSSPSHTLTHSFHLFPSSLFSSPLSTSPLLTQSLSTTPPFIYIYIKK